MNAHLFDLQANGGCDESGPVDYSQGGLTLSGVERVTRVMVEGGVAAHAPTVITTGMDDYESVLPVLARACGTSWGKKHLPYIHAEGPFLSPKDGARGAHPLRAIQVPSIAVCRRILELAEGQIGMMTVAPELDGALELIAFLVESGVIVSLGHHLADFDTLEAARRAGATVCTHVGNACPAQMHRHEERLLWQLTAPEMTAMLITDGHHLPRGFTLAALRARGIDRSIVTSDISPLGQAPPGEYTIFGGLNTVVKERGPVTSPTTGSLAGSWATLRQCLDQLELWGVSEADCTRLGSTNPWQLAQPVLTRLGKSVAQFG